MTDTDPQLTYRAQWSPEYHEYFGLCLEFPAVCVRAFTAHEAAEQRVSLNQWVVQKLAARPMVSFDDF